ncbi:hypothetical protein BD779DRAFT_1701962 [Infundibulicybe gibba]|nr:hypothetical protein BD779DRAFT_1701962 [Infundibulicybe gibba]
MSRVTWRRCPAQVDICDGNPRGLKNHTFSVLYLISVHKKCPQAIKSITSRQAEKVVTKGKTKKGKVFEKGSMATEGPSGRPLYWTEFLSFFQVQVSQIRPLGINLSFPDKRFFKAFVWKALLLASELLQTIHVGGRQSTTITQRPSIEKVHLFFIFSDSNLALSISFVASISSTGAVSSPLEPFATPHSSTLTFVPPSLVIVAGSATSGVDYNGATGGIAGAVENERQSLSGRGCNFEQSVESLVWTEAGRPSPRDCDCQSVTDARKQAASDKDTKKFMKNLPLIIDYEDRAVGRVQMALCDFKDLYELRVPRAIIMEQLFPITELADAASAAPVYRDIVDCYRWLYDVCEIRHSDISINNLMYRKEDDGIIIHGVLNDFDLARCGDFTGPQSRQRTGTKQFMAYDLLDPHESHQHFYRHDLESIFYVMVFHLCGHHQGEEVNFISIEDWVGVPDKALWKTKYNFLGRPMPPTPTDNFAPLRSWIIRLALIFRQGYSARVDFATSALLNDSNSDGDLKPFNEETLGGHVTFDIFLDIIKLP